MPAFPPKPAPGVVWLRPGATSATAAIDTQDHRVNLYVGINGEPVFVILDSGDSGFTLDLSVVDLLKIKHPGTQQVRGYGGQVSSFPFVLDMLEVPGELSFPHLSGRAIYSDFFNPQRPVIPFVGLIGYPLLSQLVTQVDSAGQSVTFFAPSAWKPSVRDGLALPIDLSERIPTFMARIDNLPPARFMIDTGDPLTVHLYASYVTENKLNTKYTNSRESGGAGLGGDYKSRQVRLSSLTVGGVTMTDIPCTMAADSKGGLLSSVAGSIGMQVLERYIVTFDYPHHRVFFAPNPDAARAFDTRTFGMTVIEAPDDLVRGRMHYKIGGISDKAPAYRDGLSYGMELTQIDGKPVQLLGLAEIRRILSPAGGRDTHEVTAINLNSLAAHYKVSLYDPLPPQTKRPDNTTSKSTL